MAAEKPVGKRTLQSRIQHYCELVLSRASWAQIKQKHEKKKETEKRKVSRGVSLSEAEIKKAQALAAAGWTNEKLGRHFGVSAGQIFKHCKGIKRGHRDGR